MTFRHILLAHPKLCHLPAPEPNPHSRLSHRTGVAVRNHDQEQVETPHFTVATSGRCLPQTSTASPHALGRQLDSYPTEKNGAIRWKPHSVPQSSPCASVPTSLCPVLSVFLRRREGAPSPPRPVSPLLLPFLYLSSSNFKVRSFPSS